MLRGSVVRWLLLCVWFFSVSSQKCPRTREGFTLIQTIRRSRPIWAEQTMLYTPNREEYQRCQNFSMGCMVSEMETLLEEWTIYNSKIRKIVRILKKMQNCSKNQEDDCVQCERFKEQPATTFLDFLDSTLQEMNAKS